MYSCLITCILEIISGRCLQKSRSNRARHTPGRSRVSSRQASTRTRGGSTSCTRSSSRRKKETVKPKRISIATTKKTAAPWAPKKASPLPCRKGFHAVGTRCYRFVRDPVDWQNAALYCGAHGAALARYNSYVDKSLNDFMKMIPKIILQAQGKLYGAKKPVVTWVGGNTQVLQYNQRKGKTPYQVDPPRLIHETKFNDKKGCYMATFMKNGQIALEPNVDCMAKLPFICGYDNRIDYAFDPLNFVVIKTKLTYEEAIVKCNALKRPVASIMSTEQQEVVKKLVFSNGEDAWISAKYDAAKRAFRWADNSFVVYSNWQDGVPRNEKGWWAHHCTAVYKRTGQWNTFRCRNKKSVVCGPREQRKALRFTPFYPVDGFHCVYALKEGLRRLKTKEHICAKPKLMECRAKTKNGMVWITNNNQGYDTIKCSDNEISCKSGIELDCSTFQIRFLCPQEENQCEELERLNAPACTGGQVCSSAPNHFVCRCPPGFMYSESSKKCVKFCGECYAWGDPHYRTLSGKKYDFMGTCKYKFTGVCNETEFATKPHFDIYTTNVPCANIHRRDGTCLSSVEIHLRNIPVRFPCGFTKKENFVFKVNVRDKAYQLNSEKVTDQITERDGVYKAVVRSHYFSLVVYALDLRVLLNGIDLRVRVPDVFRGKLCGLCGDCGTDQFTMRNGTKVNVPHSQGRYNATAIIPVGLEWMEKTDEFKKQTCGASLHESKCTRSQKRKLRDRNLCGIFQQRNGPLQECFNSTKLDPKTFFLDCVFDLCEMKDPAVAVCGMLETFAQECIAQGVPVNWRRPDFCPMECPAGQVYRVDASCPKRCGDAPGKMSACDEDPAEGCVCEDGLYLLGDRCVSKDQCGCQIKDDNGIYIKTLQANQSLVMPGCREQVMCKKKIDGSLYTKYIDYVIPPNSVCTNEVPPKIKCARGFEIGDDGTTCTREFNNCTKGYKGKFGWCIRDPPEDASWREAVYKCNNLRGTLIYVDTKEKVKFIKKLMEANKWESLYVAGRVKAISTYGFVTFKPILNGSEQGSVEWANFDVYEPFMDKILLDEKIEANDILKTGIDLSIVAEFSHGEIVFRAVPSDVSIHFACEQRHHVTGIVGENDTAWFGPCNTDTDMADGGDQETRLNMVADPTCLICPEPLAVRCERVNGSKGVDGKCELNEKGLYYSCNQGKECADNAVSVKCVKDADECSTKRDDCPKNSECINTVGAFMCQCASNFPLMINGQCIAEDTCRMWSHGIPKHEGYNFNLFSGVRTTFNENCKFTMASVCEKSYDVKNYLPYFSVCDVSVTFSGKRMEVLAITIFNPATNSSQTAVVTPSHLKKGTLFIGPDRSNIKEATLSFTDKSIRTSFTLITKNKIVIRHLDNFFKITASFPIDVQVNVADHYKGKLCGVCTAPTAGNKLLLSEEKLKEVSVDARRQCGSSKEGTRTIRTKSITSSPETTTKPTPTVCNVEILAFCKQLSSFCAVSRRKCEASLCPGEIRPCAYLKSSLIQCNTGEQLTKFVKTINSEKECTDHRELRYTRLSLLPTCANPKYLCAAKESSGRDYAFTCACRDGYLLSGADCVKPDQCGCVLKDKTYRKINSKWRSSDCKNVMTCSAPNQIVTTLSPCGKNTRCVKDMNGHACRCLQGMTGNPEKSEGCS